MNEHSPDYLVIGHVAKDKVPSGGILGGTCGYAALTAYKLGQRTVAVTSYGPDIPSLAALGGIEIRNLPHRQSTVFENIYENGRRRQKWLATAAPLSLENVPMVWRKTPIVHLAPLSQEMSPTMCGEFPDSFVGVTLQGWLRGEDAKSNVIYRSHPDLEAWLPNVDVVVCSVADFIGDRAAMTHLLTSVKLGVETLGPEGCRVYHGGGVTHIPLRREVEVDPTGAGDIFAAAFFIRYRDTGNVVQAAQFANACASLSVRGRGMEGIPSLADVGAHLAELYGS